MLSKHRRIAVQATALPSELPSHILLDRPFITIKQFVVISLSVSLILARHELFITQGISFHRMCSQFVSVLRSATRVATELPSHIMTHSFVLLSFKAFVPIFYLCSPYRLIDRFLYVVLKIGFEPIKKLF